MRHLVRSVALGAVLLGASGCESVRDLEAQSRVDPQTIALYRLASTPQNESERCPVAPTGRYANEVGKRGSYNDRGPADNHTGAVPLDCFNFPNETDAAYSSAAKFEKNKNAYDQAAGPEQQKLQARYARNRLASILIKQSDDICTVEMGRLVSRDAMVNTGLSFADSALSTAAGVATGQLAHRILAGGSGLANATRENFNANVYRNVMSTAVAKAIDKDRTRQLALIDANSTKDTFDYPVDRMIMDVNEYHHTCSFYRGLELVLDAVSRNENTDEYIRATAEIGMLKDELADLDARIKNASGKEKTALIAKRSAKMDDLTAAESARTKSILPAAAAAKPSDPKDTSGDKK